MSDIIIILKLLKSVFNGTLSGSYSTEVVRQNPLLRVSPPSLWNHTEVYGFMYQPC